MRRFLWLLIPSALFAFTLGILWHFGERRLAAFLVREASVTIKEKINWNLKIDRLNIHLAPPGIEITTLRISPEKATPWITPIRADSIIANLDFLNLLAGQIKFSIIHIKGLATEISSNQIPPSDKPIEKLPISEIFEALTFIPIKMVYLENSTLALSFNEKMSPLAVKGDILLQSAPSTINYGIKLTAENIEVAPSNPPPISLRAKGTLTQKTLNVNTFELASANSKFGMQGEFINFSNVIKNPNFSGLLDLSLQGEDLNLWLKSFSIGQTQTLKGIIKSQGSLEIEKWQEPKFDLSTEIKSAAINDYRLGDLKAQLRLNKKLLATDELNLQHPAGNLVIKDFLWNYHSDELRSNIDLKQLDLQKLFNEIHLNRIPVELLLMGKLDCSGKFLHSFGIECKGRLDGKNLDVRTQYKGTGAPIVALPSFAGEGTVTVNSKEVIYNSAVILPNSRGQSQGVINFANGFVIDFDSESFDFKDMSPLAGLKFEGKSKLRGRTQGDSQAASFEISLSTQDLWFEDFALGNIDGKVSYLRGHLLIDAPKARLFNSQYIAEIDVDLNQSKLKGLVESPEILASDAITALSRRVNVPFTATGIGKTRAQFQGPFELGKLSYTFEGILEKGDVQGENYDEIRWNWVAKEGHVTIDNNSIRKAKALITVNGKAAPTGHWALEVDGNNFKLENSTFLSKYVKTLGGDIDFHMSISNHILNPNVYLEGKVTHTALGESELPDSKFIFETDSFGKSLSIDLMGQQFRIDLDLPHKADDPARLFLEVNKFDFAEFLALLMGSPLRNDYRSMLSLRMDLQSETNDIFASSGSLRVDEIYLSRGEHFLKNNKPMFIQFENGWATLKDFSIKGFQSEITATGEKFSPQQLKLNVGGSIDLRLVQLFTPFLEDISGPVKGQISISGSVQSPEVYGNVDLNEVAIKLKDFPPVFDHINSHLEFSQKRIIIESIRGSLAGGSLIGDGSISINGIKDVKVDVKAQLRNVQMEVPEHIQSSGSADLVFSGSWFPYTLSGSYRINQAFIDKDFSTESTDGNLRQSIYLPKTITSSGFDAVVLDMQVLLDKKIEIKNPQMSGFLTGQLQVKGPPSSPILLGTIRTLPQAQLFFRDKIFEVQSGSVKFTDPSELNPDLYFTARSMVDKYEVNLLLQGKAKAPQLSLTSQPPLPEQDIISLLALGVTTQKLDSQIQSSQQAAQTGYQLGSAIISANPLNKEIKQSLGVDVKFSSGFDDTKNIALPRVTVSKDIIPRKLNASATSSFSEKQQYDVRFQYLLNDRFSTVVTYEKAEGQDGASVTGTNQQETSIFGLDLEYKVEFK